MSQKTNSRSIKKILGIILILLVLGGGSAFAYNLWFAPEEVAAETTMKTASIRQGDLTLYATGTGSLISATDATFGFDSIGQVTLVNVTVGDMVEAGDVLAEIDDTDVYLTYQDAVRSLNEIVSPSAIASAKQAIAEAELSLIDTEAYLGYLISPSILTWEENVLEAQNALVTAEAENNADKIAEAETSLATAEAKLEYAQNDYYVYVDETFAETETDARTGDEKTIWYYDEKGNRYKNLLIPTDLDVAQARASYELSQATLDEAKWYLAVLQGEEVPENATGSQLAIFESAQTKVDNSLADFEATQLAAPISGMVISLDINIGDQVSSQSSIITVADTSTAYLEIFLDETDWGMIAVDYPVEVVFDVLSDKVFTGIVESVDPALYTSSNTSVVRAIVRLDDTSYSGTKLPLGSAAAIEVIGGKAEEAILVPVEALREASPGQYTVFVMVDGEPKLRVVEVGLQDLFYAEIFSGLEVGDVVTTGIAETE